MTPKFALYCNVANVVLISIWTSDNLFRQEYLICMQGGRRHVLWLPPFTSSANAVSQRWREYFFAKDNVQILKQMEDLLNSQLDILMYFIIISLLDGNMFFKSDKETCLHLSGWFNSTACLQTPRLSHSFQGAHQYTGTVEENLFFSPRPNLERSFPSRAWKMSGLCLSPSTRQRPCEGGCPWWEYGWGNILFFLLSLLSLFPSIFTFTSKTIDLG